MLSTYFEALRDDGSLEHFEHKAAGIKSEEDPREKNLGLNLTECRPSSAEGGLTDMIGPILAALGVSVTGFDLV